MSTTDDVDKLMGLLRNLCVCENSMLEEQIPETSTPVLIKVLLIKVLKNQRCFFRDQ